MRRSIDALLVLSVLGLAACAGPPREGGRSATNVQCAEEKPFGSHIVQPRCRTVEDQEAARSGVSEYEGEMRRNPTRDGNVPDT